MLNDVVILDGYTDEPAGLGVPPYINTYPRLIAGAIWSNNKKARIRYWTIDMVRNDLSGFLNDAKRSDLVIIITGSEVPGKYIGGTPIKPHEIERIAFLLRDKKKILCGPGARYGIGIGGGRLAIDPSRYRALFDEVVTGDIEIYLDELIKHGFEKARPYLLRDKYDDLVEKFFILGTRIVQQHPNFGKNLIVEIETYRGCPRWITGGCSFCIEPRYGRPIMREPMNVIREIEELYKLGVRHIRIGKQPDILAYMASKIGEEEFPEPNTEALEKLFRGIRHVAPGLATLHIDNVNPGTIAKHPEISIKALKIIIKYNTPGDVAALGIESFDPDVVKSNNLKVYPDEALNAIRIVNKVGKIRGWNNLPYLLPGINLLYGLPGESRKTYEINEEYLKEILKEGLLVRRVNIRQVSVLANTPLWLRSDIVFHVINRHKRLFHSHRIRVMNLFDKEMLKRIVPEGTVLHYLYVEGYSRGFSIARFPGSYPIAVKIPGEIPRYSIVNTRIIKHSSKSVLGELI
ncbi:MAG: radical SAM protein [Desulfurococcaceae archaeon]